ncbi:MAG: energy transducer TonB [Candidatus Acidiferrales bacterium]
MKLNTLIKSDPAYSLRLARARFILILILCVASAFATSLISSEASSSDKTGFDNSASGLKRLMQDVMKTAAGGDQSKLQDLTSSLVLPNADAWFTRVFGPDLGSRFALDYDQRVSSLPRSIAMSFTQAAGNKFTSVEVQRFTKTCDSAADDDEYPLLFSRKEQEPLSRVRFENGGMYQAIRYFAFADGYFRYVGQLGVNDETSSRTSRSPNPPDSQGSSKDADQSPEVPQAVQMQRLLKRIEPSYPKDAEANHDTDKVTVRILVSKEGTVSAVTPIKGRCMFVEATIQAVRQWRFSPLLINGTPSESLSYVDINFAPRH